MLSLLDPKQKERARQQPRPEGIQVRYQNEKLKLKNHVAFFQDIVPFCKRFERIPRNSKAL